MRVRLAFSTAAYAQTLTTAFLVFALVGFIRQQDYFVRSIHQLADAKSLFLISEHDYIENFLSQPASPPTPLRVQALSTVQSSIQQTARTDLHTCQLSDNTTTTFPQAPSFIIIGAQKAGSSTLADYLKLHPKIVSSNSERDKELHFLDWMVPFKEVRNKQKEDMNVTEEQLWCQYREKYAKLFDLELLQSQPSVIAFEKTPSYMVHGYYLPEILRQVCPWNPKLIAILRNPIDRAFSQYNMDIHQSLKLRNETSFEMVLENELEALRILKLSNAPRLSSDHWDKSLFDLPSMSQTEIDQAHKKLFRRVFLGNYLQRGMYAVQLKRWKQVFGDKLLVVRYEDLYGPDSERYYHQILRHIGVDLEPLPAEDELHWSRLRYRRSLSNRTRAYLDLFFRPYNALLAELLGWPDLTRRWS
jgi:hypothetical protein